MTQTGGLVELGEKKGSYLSIELSHIEANFWTPANDKEKDAEMLKRKKIGALYTPVP